MRETYRRLLSLYKFPPDLAAPSNAVISRKATPSPTRTSKAFPPVAAGGSIGVTRARVDIFILSSVLLRARQLEFMPWLLLRRDTGCWGAFVDFTANFVDHF